MDDKLGILVAFNIEHIQDSAKESGTFLFTSLYVVYHTHVES